MQLINIIVPCYNEQECVHLFYDEARRCLDELKNFEYSIMFIDDGSSDNTLAEIKKLITNVGGERIKYVSFSRNFGKEAAIYAGLQKSTGDIVVLMDCDLQDPPELIPEMLEAIGSGCDSVATYRVNRHGEPPVRSAFAMFFYRIMNSMSVVKMKPAARDYRMMTRKYVDALLSLSEVERFSKGLFQWVGFETKWIPYKIVERAAGKTKWSFFKLYNYAVGGIVAFSTVPLRIASLLGMLTVFTAVILAVITLKNVLRVGIIGAGFSVIATLVLFFSGVVIMLLGIIGEYLAKLYSEVKHRPIYIEKESSK
jgi:glycosyltransferase involved in cell wall biosynthesis